MSQSPRATVGFNPTSSSFVLGFFLSSLTLPELRGSIHQISASKLLYVLMLNLLIQKTALVINKSWGILGNVLFV